MGRAGFLVSTIVFVALVFIGYLSWQSLDNTENGDGRGYSATLVIPEVKAFPGESSESLIARSNSAGTGYVYVDSYMELTVSGPIYVTNQDELGENPKVFTPRGWYMWEDKAEGVDSIDCVYDAETTTGFYVAYYCEIEGLSQD